jgi:hypothetical protein
MFSPESIVNKHMKKADRARQYLNTSAFTRTDPYVPFGSGRLSQQVDYGGKTQFKKIIYRASHARRQYYGIPDKNKKRHFKAAMRWFEEMKRVQGEALVKGAKQEYGKS